ncbi:MAG: hypothetical protein GXP32_00425 [Kiritimatiellaeota bacterium]|nr:hypothetical protein [Kiritimatiellota bacterium]
MKKREKDLLRELAEKYKEIASKEIQDERRGLWRQKNSLCLKRPLIYIRAVAWNELPESECGIEDSLFRGIETFLKKMIYQDSLNDDFIIEPWVSVNAVHNHYGWGMSGERHFTDEEIGSYKEDYHIREYRDIEKLVVPTHSIDERKTAENLEKVQDAIGDIITVNLNRGPAYKMWNGDISTDLGHLRGIENFMLDMMDNPEWLHKLVSFMSDGVLKAQKEAEAAGDWSLSEHQNQAMPYAEELRDPAPNSFGVPREDLWCFMAAQEFTAVSPAMHEEFLLQYQMPIMRDFGLVAYGCCEDLTNKIEMLKQIPNLRRIAVSPFADVAKCAERIGTDYVLSYRPSPSDMVGYGFNPDRIRSILRKDFEFLRNSYMDITLKDVETVQGDPYRIRKWVEVTRGVIDEFWD